MQNLVSNLTPKKLLTTYIYTYQKIWPNDHVPQGLLEIGTTAQYPEKILNKTRKYPLRWYILGSGAPGTPGVNP